MIPQVFEHFLQFKSEALRRIAKAEQDLKDTQADAESIKTAAIQNYIEKEHLIMELHSKTEKLEGKIIFYEETQADIQKEREQMQKKIIDLATMLDKEAEVNERRRKELESEINEKVELRTLENLRKFEESKSQMMQTMHVADERMRRFEETETVLKKKLKQTEEKYEREIEVFKKTIEANPEKLQIQEEYQQINWKYEKKIAELIKEHEKEKEELREGLEKLYREKEELKRKNETAENELRRLNQERSFMLKKIDEKTHQVEEHEEKLITMKQQYTEKIIEMENTFAEEKKSQELRHKSEYNIDDVSFF